MKPELYKTTYISIGLLVLLLSQGAFLTCYATTSPQAETTKEPALLLKAGKPLTAGMQTEDIIATYDVVLAKAQVAAYPESPEASFVLAVALTRTSMVEDALQEVRRARKLAEKQGGPAYFDHMISQYEDMLKSYPKDNHVRYGLAWAYYMKAYVLTHYARSAQAAGIANKSQPNWQTTWIQGLTKSPSSAAATTNDTSIVKTTRASAGLPPEIAAQVNSYYDAALHNLDQLLALEPNDMWAKAYRAYLQAEYTGNLQNAMDIWKACLAIAPSNPAAYFFLGQGYLKEGNFKECLQNISKAVALRDIPLQ